MNNPVDLKNIRSITVSGRIATGASTLAHHLAKKLRWEFLDGGKLFRDFTKDHGYAGNRADDFDLAYEERVKNILTTKSHQIIQSHLAGFDAQEIPEVFKILLLCEDEEGNDKTDIRIDRLVNRDDITVETAKHEVLERERQNLEKWRRLYAKNDQNWVYWDKKYYDFVLNTYDHNPDESLRVVLEAMGFSGNQE